VQFSGFACFTIENPITIKTRKIGRDPNFYFVYFRESDRRPIRKVSHVGRLRRGKDLRHFR